MPKSNEGKRRGVVVLLVFVAFTLALGDEPLVEDETNGMSNGMLGTEQKTGPVEWMWNLPPPEVPPEPFCTKAMQPFIKDFSPELTRYTAELFVPAGVTMQQRDMVNLFPSKFKEYYVPKQTKSLVIALNQKVLEELPLILHDKLVEQLVERLSRTLTPNIATFLQSSTISHIAQAVTASAGNALVDSLYQTATQLYTTSNWRLYFKCFYARNRCLSEHKEPEACMSVSKECEPIYNGGLHPTARKYSTPF
eukprot:gnl/Hemi2/16400_TR5470_c0_g1_i1.p1 gnl/Hemi2/16400_TR5470_c0_g1~~gnl/Hemi2/16400_TR5470_c0_g1_i1.p1  ORF type:complete len:251 (+),score=6.37 gnl/Hemi2/16400_TR5470_c0_g1_i1:96-848(+)